MFRNVAFDGSRVLVTGHSGFSGTWLCHLLESQGANVMGFSRDSSSFSTIFPDDELSDRFPTVFGRVEEEAELTRTIQTFQPHVVIHLAAQSLVLEGFADPVGTFRTNTLGTAQVLESSLTSDSLRGVLIVTTDKVYADSSAIKFESSALGGNDPYSSSKVAAEAVVRAYQNTYRSAGVSLSVVRGGNVIGGGDWSRNRLVPDLIKATFKNSALVIRYPNSIRPWQHVLDLVFAYSLLAWKMLEEPSPTTNTEYNVGPDPETLISVTGLLSLFAKNDLPMTYLVQPGANHEAESLVINSSKIKSAIGWKPFLETPRAVQLTAQWYLAVVRDHKNAHEETRRQIMEYLSLD